MTDAVNMVVTFWNEIIITLPDTPFMFLIALAIVLIILDEVYALFRIKFR